MNINDWLKYGVELIRVIAWPVTVFLIVKKFEKEIKDLIKDIKISLSFGDKKVVITHEKAEELKQKQEKAIDQAEVKELKEENKRHKDIEKTLLEINENVTKGRDSLFLGHHFEKSYRLIFGSQLTILNLACQHGKVTEAMALAIYRRTIWATSYPYQNYIGFLITSGFITQLNPSDESYSILSVGKLFMDYLISNNIVLNKIPY